VLGAPAHIHVGVFIATRTSKHLLADVEGWHLAEAIAALAQWNHFNSPSFDRIEIENLWSAKQERKQICIMGVAWCA
jgi:hypothetical protein